MNFRPLEEKGSKVTLSKTLIKTDLQPIFRQHIFHAFLI